MKNSICLLANIAAPGDGRAPVLGRAHTRLSTLLILSLGVAALDGRADELADSGSKVKVQAVIPLKAHAFALEDVRLLDGPFKHAMEMDGRYYSMLNFFDRVAHLERIINVAELQMATVKKPSDAKVKHTYEYAAGESIVVSCVTTTFFSHDQGGPLQTAKGSAIRPVSATVPAR